MAIPNRIILAISLKASLIIALFTVAHPAQAEYYLAYTAACSGYLCNSPPPCHKTYHTYKHHRHHYVHTYHRPYHRPNSYKIEVLYPVQPACPCSAEWAPGHCNRCGGWVSGYWRSGAPEGVYYAQPEYYRDYGDSYYSSREDTYNPDLATGDDNASINPGMNIDY